MLNSQVGTLKKKTSNTIFDVWLISYVIRCESKSVIIRIKLLEYMHEYIQ